MSNDGLDLERLLLQLPRARDGTGIIDKVHPAYQGIQANIAHLMGWTDPTSVNLAFGQVSPKMSAGPAFFREGLDDPFEVLMLRTVQQQIGLGGPAKWMVGGGGFISSKPLTGPNGPYFETPAACAVRCCKARLGFDLKMPLNAMWVPITKEPYDVTNETFVHGIIWKAPLYMNRRSVQELEAAMQAKGAVTAWMGRQVFEEMVASGDHTLDPGEIDFILGCMEKRYLMIHYG